VTIVVCQLMFSSPKDLCGDEILRHQLFLFSFYFYFINFGVTIVLRHLKIYMVTKYCVTDYFYLIYYFFIKLWGDDIIVSPEILRHLRLYGVTNMVSSPIVFVT
jgi:hypothetical protein